MREALWEVIGSAVFVMVLGAFTVLLWIATP